MISSDDESAKTTTKKKIDFVHEERAKLVAELQTFHQASGRQDLLALQKDMHDVRNEMQQLESEIDGPAAIAIIMPATVQRK